MKRFLALVLLLASLLPLHAQETTTEEKPLLRVAAISDIHNELGMISSSLSKIRLRPTFLSTLDSLKRAGGVDVLALLGDYTSDCTISSSNWRRVRKLMVDATRDAFPADAERRPVLWVTGNHDYEVANFDALPKSYNAGDYYSTPMMEDIGELTDDECFYETAQNGTLSARKLLAAYHYVIGGFDFVALNCGKYFHTSAWDYQYSQESVDWVDGKLAELTADDPDRTIFVLVHLPLPSSVGATSNKTMSKNAPSSYSLERALAKYPGVICLYGHDHSSSQNKSYYERSILQRFTCYDNLGNVIAPYGEEVGVEPSQPEEPANDEVDFQNVASGEYLGFNSHNLTVLSTTNPWKVTPSSLVSGTFCVEADNGPTGTKLHCGSSGRFSGNGSLSNNSSILFYEVDPETLVGTRTTTPECGKTYALVGLSSSGGYYAVTNEQYSPGTSSQRLVGSKCTNANSQTFASSTALWQMTKHEKPATGEPSFLSVFVGSMRYNSLDTNATPNENDPRMIQTLVVELYADRVVFTMKNFGETGTLVGAAVTANIFNPLPQYVIHRPVHGTTAPDTTPVPSLTAAPTDQRGRVVSLTGLDLGPAATLSTLPAGVYVVNGRKVVRK